jgi:serine/threonine protein phosphatase PrpC
MVGNLAHFAHVGDSRAYLINQRGIEQITRDHSLVQRLIELNQLTLDEAKEHSQRNVLYRALGQSVDLEVDVQTRRMPPASNILLCSDGLWGWVEEHNIQKTIQETHDPQEACNKLIAQANANGGPDNITAILLKMPSPVA